MKLLGGCRLDGPDDRENSTAPMVEFSGCQPMPPDGSGLRHVQPDQRQERCDRLRLR